MTKKDFADAIAQESSSGKKDSEATLVVLSKRWVVERSFAWLEKCRRLWKKLRKKTSNQTSNGSSIFFLACCSKDFKQVLRKK